MACNLPSNVHIKNNSHPTFSLREDMSPYRWLHFQLPPPWISLPAHRELISLITINVSIIPTKFALRTVISHYSAMGRGVPNIHLVRF